MGKVWSCDCGIKKIAYYVCGGTYMQNKKVLELDSFFGKLVACDEYVEIIPMYVTDSRKQGRKFYYQNISGITCKEPSVWWGPGYIQFIIPGEQAKQIKWMDKGWKKTVKNDPNSLLLSVIGKDYKKRYKEFIDFLNKKISGKPESTADVANDLNQLKALKELLDCGAINKQEFEEEKRKILNRI